MKKLLLILLTILPIWAMSQDGGRSEKEIKASYLYVDSLQEATPSTYNFAVWNIITGKAEYITSISVTHTGEVTGETTLVVDPTAVSNKTLKSTLVGTEEVLINDAGTLKKTTSQDIADLSGGGGASILDLIGHQKGGWSATSSTSQFGTWGLGYGAAVTATTKTSSSDSDGIYLRLKPSGASDNVMYFRDGFSTARFTAGMKPKFAIKWKITHSSSRSLKIGLSNVSTDSYDYDPSQHNIALVTDGSSAMRFITTDGSSGTTTATGVSTNNVAYTLVVDVVSTSEVKFYLYDDDYTEVASATHTTNIPAGTMRLTTTYKDDAGSVNNWIYFYYTEIMLNK